MRAKEITTPDGQTLQTVELDFDPVKEPWVELALEDGRVLKVKLIVHTVRRVEGEFDEDGNPKYIVEHATIAKVRSE